MGRKKSASWDETIERPLIGKFERWGRNQIYSLASIFLPKGEHKDFSFKNAKRILLIKEPYRIGDLLQITPTIRALKKNLPGLYLGLVVRERNYELFKNNPYLDEIFIFEKNLFSRPTWRAVQFFKKIRARKFEIAVTLETERAHLSNDLTAFFSGAPIRLRYDGHFLGSPESNIFYNRLVPYDTGAVHEVDRNFAVFKPFGLTLENRSLFLQISQEDLKSAKKILESAFSAYHLPPTTSFLSVHPGAYKLNNRWPLENYMAVCEEIKKRGKQPLFLLGPAEEEWKTPIYNRGFFVISGISILELAGIFKLSELVLCNDTGMMHIAAAVGAKTVALFGQTDPLRWKPPGENVYVIRSPEKKISSISVETVLSAVTKS